MKKLNRNLNVLMNGILIGTLEKSAKSGLTFVYDSQWLQTPGARPISLSLPLINRAFTGDVVYHFFDNLLPDNPQIRARIQTKFHLATDQPFELLESIGKDCVGAIQLIAGDPPIFNKNIRAEPLRDKEIAALLRDYQHHPLGMSDDAAEFRISIAGAQEKSAFLYYRNKWCRPLGDTPTSHIFKLPIGFIQHQHLDLSDNCENEWLCAQIAKEFGLPIAECEILYFDDIKILAVKRFDRLLQNKTWLMRLPQEDICQALGISPNLKYQADGGPGIKEVMNLLLGSTQPASDRELFFRSQVLFWILAAIDGHAKNFSLFIEPGGKYRLTPLYDIMSAYPLIAKKQLQKQKIKMAMALKGKSNHYLWHNVQRRHFIEAAKAANFSPEKAENILNDMLDNIDKVIASVSAKIPKKFPEEIARSIFTGMREMKLQLSK